MGFFSSVSSAVQNVAQKVAAPVVSVAQKTRDVVNTPIGSAALPFAAILSPTGRSNLAQLATQVAGPAASIIGGPAAAGVAQNLANVGAGYFIEQPPPAEAGGFFSTPGTGYGGVGGGYQQPYYGGGMPSWVLPVGIAAVGGLVLILALRK